MIEHMNITVKGRVQGVWFRASTKEIALEIGIKGFVKNLLNKNVYIEAEGSSEQLQQFLNWCKKGPRLSHVVELESNKGLVQHYTSFEIR